MMQASIFVVDDQSEGEIPLDAYPNVRAWIARIKALPGFVAMPGM